MKKHRDLVLVGGGGHCKSVIEAAESAGFRIHGVLDIPEHIGQTVLSGRIIGTDDDLRAAGGRLATIIASTAYVSKYASVGEGTVILHQAVVNAGAQIGCGCIINTLANIEHDAVVGDYCHISTGAMVNGDCKVGARTFLGSGSVMVNGISLYGDAP